MFLAENFRERKKVSGLNYRVGGTVLEMMGTTMKMPYVMKPTSISNVKVINTRKLGPNVSSMKLIITKNQTFIICILVIFLHEYVW